MSRIITGLERSRLAERRGDSKDARRVRIHATPAGSACCTRAGGAELNIWPAISTALPGGTGHP